jgi:carboxylesterase
MGGVVTLTLACEGLADAIAVVGTPLRLRPAPLVALVPVAKHFHHYLPKREGSDIRNAEARARHPGYPKMPLASVHELMKMQRQLRGRLHQITAPVLVAHGALDSTAYPGDASTIVAEVSSDARRLIHCPNSAHVVPVDHDGAQLASAIADFFLGARRVEGPVR